MASTKQSGTVKDVTTPYMEWLLTAQSDRIPATMAELADTLAVPLATLQTMLHDPSFLAQVGQQMRTAFANYLPTLLGAFLDGIKNATPAQQKAFLETLGLLSPEGKAPLGPKIIIGIDPEKL